MNESKKTDIISALLNRLNVGLLFACKNENEFVLFDSDEVAIYIGGFDETIGFINGVNYLADKILVRLEGV